MTGLVMTKWLIGASMTERNIFGVGEELEITSITCLASVFLKRAFFCRINTLHLKTNQLIC